MSNGSVAQQMLCATYFSANDNALDNVFCTEPGGGYITPHKDFLGWVPAANKVVIKTATTQTVKLEADAWPLGAGIKMIKVCLAGERCSGDRAHYLAVEARMTGRQFDDGLPGDGVIIHDVRMDRGPIGGRCFFNNQSGWAVTIDATPNDWRGPPNCDSGGRTWPNYALGNAQFMVGDTYRNNALHVTISVMKKKGAAYNVRVRRTQ
jgi:hypothetical protein